jgi:hypothetical protein
VYDLRQFLGFGPTIVRLLQSPLVLVGQPVGSLQQRAHVTPDSLLEMVAANGVVVADRGAAKAVSVRPGAAIMAILALAAVTARYGRRLAVVGIPAAMADRQPLQQPARSTQAVALALAVFRQLDLGSLEYRRVDQGRHRHLDPLLAGHGDPHSWALRRLRMAP